MLGGLPLWAECSFSRGDGWGDDDCSVDALYWLKRDGTKGKEVSQKIIDRLDKDPCWESDVCLLVSEQAAYEADANMTGDERYEPRVKP